MDPEKGPLGPEEESPLDARPKSYSRPFHDPRLQDHPAYRHSRDEPPRALVYASEARQPEDHLQQYLPGNQYDQARQFNQSPPANNGRGRVDDGSNHAMHSRPSQPIYGQPGQEEALHSQQLRTDGAYLPRPHTTEYQLPGVGPPPPTPPSKPKSRPGSMIFRSRSKSRSRGNTATSATADDASENYDEPETKSKRRSSIFRSFNKPQSQDSSRSSTRQNGPGSRDDLLQTISPAAYTLQNNALVNNEVPDHDDKKKSKKLQRAVTANAPQDAGKKKGFSRLSGLFGRSGTTGSKPSGPLQAPEKQPKLQKAQQVQQPHQQQPQQQQTPRQQMVSPPPTQDQRQQMPSSQQIAQQYREQRQQSHPPQVPQPQQQQRKSGQRWSTLSNYPTNAGQQRQQVAPARQMSVPTQSFAGQPPPVGGYYAPQNSPPPTSERPPQQSPDFLGGRRLSEQRLAEDKHNFESQNGFRGPYHPSLQPQGYPPNLRINTQYRRGESPQPQQVRSAQPRLEPTYGGSPYGSTRTGRSLTHQSSIEHARDLHRRSRSPRAGPHSPSLDETPDSIFNDPAHVLGTFRGQNNSTPRLGDQEKPWSLSIPEEEYDRRRLTNYGEVRNNTPSNRPLPAFADVGPPGGSSVGPMAAPPQGKNPLESYQNQNMQRSARKHTDSSAPVELQGSRVKGDEESDEIVMSSTAYPGQEWMPDNFGAWDGD